MSLGDFLVLAFIMLIMKIMLDKQFKQTKKRNKMGILTPKQIGEKFKKSSNFINDIFNDLDFIQKDQNGYKVTPKGQENGGIQKNYMGKNYVAWDDSILNNTLFNRTLNSQNEQPQNSDENDFRTKFKAQYRTKDGHYVRSRAEVIIADWLYSEYITYAYEKLVPINEEMYCDFYIPQGKIYIEFWGLEDEKYQNRKAKKIELYAKNGLKLIQIDDKAINNIDDFLPKELLKFGFRIE